LAVAQAVILAAAAMADLAEVVADLGVIGLAEAAFRAKETMEGVARLLSKVAVAVALQQAEPLVLVVVAGATAALG
jgi:hypothetical protein